MIKNILSAALLAGFGVAALLPSPAQASDGTLTITGQVTSATCTVKINGGSNNQTVVLPTVQSSQFTAAGIATGFTAVTFALSNCAAGSGTPAVTKVLPYFEQGANTDMTLGYLKNNGTATNVEVLLSNTADTTSKLALQQASGNQNAGTALAISGNPSFQYYASYISTAASVGAGTVTTSVQYDLNYQ